MTTYTAFTPSPTGPFQFQIILDGQAYTVQVAWNVFGQRYYVSLYSLAGALIGNIARIGSPPDYDISLSAPFGFADTLLYRASTNNFESP